MVHNSTTGSLPSRPESGEWVGFYLEGHRPDPGWMNFFLQFDENQVRGEGFDYVGPWVLQGTHQLQSGEYQWTKQYVGKHEVVYQGKREGKGIRGHWHIRSALEGEFHIWPKSESRVYAEYLEKQFPSHYRPPESLSDPFFKGLQRTHLA